MASSNEKYDDIVSLGARFANIQTKDGFTLGMETDDGILDVSATALRLGLPAPRDVDHLLQQGLGRHIRPIIDVATERPHSESSWHPPTSILRLLLRDRRK